MLLEKVPPSELSKLDKSCSGRVRRTHELAQENAERYLVGRQIFVTGIVFLIAKFIRMNDQFSTAVGTELGFLGNEYLVSIFVDTGLAGSLIVLAFGQLLPQLIVTTTPILQYQLFPTYELVWVACFLERTGIAEMANILRRLTRWAFNLVDEPFAVGSGVQYTTGKNDEDAGEAEKSCCTTYWKTWPNWWGAIKNVIGVLVFCGSLFGIVWGITHGWSDFTKWEKGVDGEYILGSDGYYISKPGDVNIWIQLLLFVPLSNIVMGFLEGSQIAILALEKAPGKTIKRVHRQAYFGHKLTQQRDNVRRYLLGRQFLVVFVDFVAAHSMGLMGLGILVPVSQLYPQLLAASNPMWFLGTFGSKFVLLLALMMEFCGFCHFSWTLFIFFFWIRGCLSNGKHEEETFSVGKAVDISGGDGDDLADAIEEADMSELKKVVVEQQQKIEVLEGIIDQDMPDRIGELVTEQLRNYFRLQDYV